MRQVLINKILKRVDYEHVGANVKIFFVLVNLTHMKTYSYAPMHLN